MATMYSEAGFFATLGGTAKTAIVLTSIAGLRPSLYEYMIGPASAPNATDCSVTYILQLFTAAGTTTSVTPQPLDIGYQAAKALAGSNATVEPTYTAGLVVDAMGINQRASYRWVASPGGAITLVGTASNGIGMQVASSNYTGQEDVVFKHQE